MKKKSTCFVFFLLLVVFTTGCFRPHNMMYLKTAKVSQYLRNPELYASSPDTSSRPARNKKVIYPIDPNMGLDQKLGRQIVLNKLPYGKTQLGGHCSDPEVRNEIDKIEGFTNVCQTNVQDMARKANLNGGFFWGLLGATAVTGAGMLIGLAITDKDTRTTTMLVFGMTSLTLALTNGLGQFDSRQERLKYKGKRVDNYMWTLRTRVVSEVCNASSKEQAIQKAKGITKQTSIMCHFKDVGDGSYKIDN